MNDPLVIVIVGVLLVVVYMELTAPDYQKQANADAWKIANEIDPWIGGN